MCRHHAERYRGAHDRCLQGTADTREHDMTYRHEWASEVDQIVAEYIDPADAGVIRDMTRDIDGLIEDVSRERFEAGVEDGERSGSDAGYEAANYDLADKFGLRDVDTFADEVDMLRTFAARVLSGETVADVLAGMSVRDIVALRGEEAIGQLGWMVAA